MRRNITFKKSAFMGLGCYLVGFFGLFLFVGAVEEVYGVGNNLANETAAILGHRLNSQVGFAGDLYGYLRHVHSVAGCMPVSTTKKF